MAYSTINRSKFGDCSQCGAKDTDVVKVKRDLFCLQCNRINKAKNQAKKATERNSIRRLGKTQRETIGVLEMERQVILAELDMTYSRIIRMSAANELGYLSCYTCGKNIHWSIAQNSHFVKRMNTLLRWDNRNNHAACKHCNEDLDGNIPEYTKRLNSEQNGLAEQLIEEGREVYKWHRSELKELLIEFRQKHSLLEKKFKK